MYAEEVPLSKLFDLSGQVAFVTGAARGVGAAIALGLAKAGAKVSPTRTVCVVRCVCGGGG